MANLKSLAKDTAIYGLSSIVGRFLNYLLVPLYTHYMPKDSGDYGVSTNIYAYTALMKPLSGSGARGMMVDAMTTYGADSFIGRLSCIFQGSTDTTFYILAVYFGSVGVVKTRHAVACGLLADLAGVIAAIAIAYLFFA